MPLLNIGRDAMAGRIVGEETAFDEANAHIAVGTGDDNFSAGHTDLQGSETFRKGMDSGYPQRTGNTMVFKSTFEGNEANFAWEEWGVANASSGGVLLNREVEYNSVKLEGQRWIFEVELTVQIGS